MPTILKHITRNGKALVMIGDDNLRSYTVQLYRVPSFADELTVQRELSSDTFTDRALADEVFYELCYVIGALPATPDFSKAG